MIPAKVEIELDRNAVKEYIQKQLNDEIREVLWFVDIEKLSQLTCMSKRYLEDEILSDPRVKIHERKKNRKRWWPAHPTFKAIDEITSEW